MKILWFTNVPMPDVNTHFNENAMGSGGWMGALLALLKDTPGLEIGVVTACTHFPESRFQVDGVEYFIVHQQKSKLRRSLFPVDNNPHYVNKCAAIVNECNPDIVHVHGTERFYAEIMTKKLVQCPVVISVQGIMTACSEWYRWFGKLPAKDILKFSLYSSLKGSGLLWELRKARQQARREQLFFRTGRYFFGRTDWDRANISYMNDQAKYFTISEIIRKPFWQCQWKLNKCQRHRIIFTNARHPRKGTELLLDAVERMKPLYPDIELILIGSLDSDSYSEYLKKKIKDLDGVVNLCGQMNAQEIANELCKAHVFVSASYIDNSPNSVAEAQLVGLPVIASYTGGVPSMVKEGETGLLFPTGDVPMLVSRLRALFDNDDLAIKLSNNARERATKRHDPETTVRDLLAAYDNIIMEANEKRADDFR